MKNKEPTPMSEDSKILRDILIEYENDCDLVWKTEAGDSVRLSHMSSLHLRNAITWLLKDGDGFSDLTDRYEGIMLGTWIQAMSSELYDRQALLVG